MDQGHDGLGDWASNSFPGAWEQQFNDPALSFNPHAPQDHGYHHSHTPDGFTTAPSEQMNHHLPPPDTQRDLYSRPYQYYTDDVWTGPPSSAVAAHAASFGQPVPHGSQGYYHDQPQQQRQTSDIHQTVDSRFTLVDPSHGHDFQPQLHTSHGQEATDPYGFGTNMARSQPPAANGYLQEAVPQWQQVASHPSEYTQNEEFNNPPAPSQSLNIPPPPPRNPSPIFSSGQGIGHPVQQKFIAAAGGQLQQQGHLPTPQSQASAMTSSPRAMPQPVAQKAVIPRPAHQQPAPRPVSGQVATSQPGLAQNVPTAQAMSRQSPAIQQHPAAAPAPSSRPVAQPSQAQQSLIKTLSPVPVPAQTAPPSAQVPPPSVQPTAPVAQPASGQAQFAAPPSAVFATDIELLEEARKREGAMYPGVPHLVIGDTPVKLKRGPPTKRYVVLSTKGGKAPLFPNSPNGWTLAESLGNHYEGYKAAESAEAANPKYRGDVDRYRADERLRLELSISDNEIPADWWKKLQATQAPEPKDEEVVHEIQFSEKMKLYSSLKSNKIARKYAYDAYFPEFLHEVDKLRQAGKMEVEEQKREWKTLSRPLETILLRGLSEFDAPILRRLGKDMRLLAKLCNLILQMNRIGEANSVLLKAILRLITFNTKLTPKELNQLKFSTLKARLEARQDPEVRDMVATILANAEKNKELDSPSPPSEMGGSGSKSDRATKAPAKALNGKRGRDEDANDDDRSGKKQATGASVKPASGAAKLPPAVSKLPGKSPAVPTAPNLAAGPVKRSNLLLPGKLRAPARPAPKAEPPKPEASKLAAKPESTSKPQSAKPEPGKPQPAKAPASQPMDSTAKPAKAKASEAPQPSRFAALLSEIDEPKKVKAADPLPTARIDPNETEDQRKRRLRKEERRRLNLRVAFRGDDRLVEIREFTRDPEEIAQSGMMRDIRSENKDKMEEGAALKKHKSKELDEWEDLTAIDFSVLPAEKRANTFVTRGGLKEFETEQQKFMQDREAKELMVVYTDVSDIPATPKSPQFEPVPYAPDDTLHLPDNVEYEEIRQRARDREALGFRRALESAQNRMAEQSKPGYAEYRKALQSVGSIAGLYNAPAAQLPKAQILDFVTAAPTQDDGPSQDQKDHLVLELLQSDRVKNWKDPDPYDAQRPKTVRRYDYGEPKVQADIDALEDLVARIKSGAAFGKAVPVASAPEPTPVVPAPQPAQATPDYSAAWAQYYAQQTQQQQTAAPAWPAQPQNAHGQAAYPQVANPYGQAGGQPGQPDANNQISALLAALHNPGNAGQQQQLPAATNDANLQAIMAAVARGQSSGQQPASIQAPTSLNSQSNEYLMSLMQLAGQAQNNAGPTAAYPHDQGHHSSARQQQPPHNSYGQGPQGGFSQPSHQERDGYGGHDNRDRDRDRDRDGDRRDRGFGRGGGFKSKGFNNQSDVPEHLRGINRNLIGTKQCSFFARGQCAKGDKCTFRHD